MNLFGKHFGKFARKGTFFLKRQLLGNYLQRLRTSGRDIAEMITNLGKSRQVGQPTVRVGPDHIVLDGNPAPHKGHSSPINFGWCLLWPNGWTDQNVTWYGGRPQRR